MSRISKSDQVERRVIPPARAKREAAAAGAVEPHVRTAEHDTAHDFIRNERGHLFVTGRAGTGKSTLLKALVADMDGEAVVVAPTGLAAVNVGGQTIHSFFGLPPRLIRQEDIRRSRNGGLMRKLKTLVIDEVSMVRSDLMWAIDQSLRLNRSKPREPFGGVRVVMFGDLHQLPPIVTDSEVIEHLETAHGGVFFFSHQGLKEAPFTSLIELSHVFRQKDAGLIEVLNKVRDGEASEGDLELLNAQVHPIRTLSEGEPYVILTPTNAAATRINLAFLNALKGDARSYQAGITGDFNDSAQPTDTNLVLKPGAKIMMLRNDADRRWVNGTIARVAKLAETSITVEIDGCEHEIEQVAWESRRYAYDKAQEKIVETVVGTFKQFPVRLAWALTIHKSQGLSLDKVYIDLGKGTFAHGQTYVALSRCRTLEGLALARPLRPVDIIFDRAAMGYRDAFHALT